MSRSLDVIIAAALLVLLAPVQLAVGVLVLILLGRPVLYRQTRTGLGGKAFVIYKFRTMTTGPGPDEARLTRFGRFLRATSLDELPELWNVVKGDMALVGPRPLLPEYLPRYNVRQRRRHEVRPGLTGWAQVNGRNALGWTERFELDVWYVDNRTAALDLRILFMTAIAVLSRRGIRHEGSVTMPKFTGHE